MIPKCKQIKEENDKKGIYLITDGVENWVDIGEQINLVNSINDFDFLIFATGSVGDGNYLHSIAMPFGSQFIAGTNQFLDWRIGIDIIAVLTSNGKITFQINSETQLEIKSRTGDYNLRCIYGVKL